ncbi:ATP-binding cassette domain-containing protein [Pseudarthrobacter sp. R1]|uniref:ABC transporter ATP-binding protein n=1 Tax=Pseudarthrobacter sp. R1 TaxID=2944934 RepID=UPI002109E209|nr:ATP-binding cassette domain-containing protein [Pseudarthrobacter sp. R1]MCQ6270530.1 ATP-binding cassette domain-containing protein [Pseudarthrobacter sp. R1]
MKTSSALAASIRSFAFHDDDAPVLRAVDVSFAPGTYTAILGGSGSGKSTLGRLLAGWLSPGAGGSLAGQLELAGTRLHFNGTAHDPRIDPARWGERVGFVPQDASTALSTVRATVAEELAFGLENAGVDRAAMREAVERTAGVLGLAGLLECHPGTLSGGQLRRLAIGCAVILEPAVLVLDEPFASLDTAGAGELALLLRKLVAGGTAVVVLSQAIDEVLLEADRWIALDAGTVAASGAPAELMAAPERLPAGIRRPVAVQRPASGAAACQVSAAAAPVLELRGVHFSYPATAGRGRKARATSNKAGGYQHNTVLQGIDLVLQPGEIVAVTGPNGAGKSTLLRHLNGLLQPATGSVLVNGKDIAGLPVGEVAASVGLLFQNPRDQLFERTAAREVRFGLDRRFGAGEAAERTAAALAAVGLSGVAQDHPAELPASGQRLLALATVLARRPSLIALDEPTVALDGDGLAVLDNAVRSAAAAGAAVVLVTHDVPYARTLADRLLTLDGGRLP